MSGWAPEIATSRAKGTFHLRGGEAHSVHFKARQVRTAVDPVGAMVLGSVMLLAGYLFKPGR